MRQGDEASAGKKAANDFFKEFGERFISQQVFNRDEFGPFWEILNRSYITQEENTSQDIS